VGSFHGRVTGGNAVRHRIAALLKVAERESLRRALVAGAIPMQNRWKELAARKTGTYRRSVHIGGVTRPEGGGDDSHVKEREPLPKPEEGRTHVVVTIGTDIVDPPYPWFLENGTAHMGAQPAAQPAFDETLEHSKHEIEAVLKLQFERAARL
jgi:HK97 gp10 family phage protein